VIALYLLLNIAYTLHLKRVPVLELFCVATGFVLRVLAGGVAIGVPVSAWALITTLSLALYLAAVKRHQEFRGSGEKSRATLSQYSVPLLKSYADTAALGTLTFYGLFVVTVRPELSITVPFVLFGLFRYGFIVEHLNGGEAPEEAVLSDFPLGLTIIAWAGLSIHALWPA